MKREFEFQPEQDNSLGGRTPTDTTESTSSRIEVYDTVNSNCKRFKGSLVNGLIVYTRERKSRFNWSNGLSENGHNEQLRSSDEPEINVNASVEDGRKGKEVQIVDCDHLICKDKELVRSPAKEGGPAGNIVVIAAQSCEGKNDFPEKEVRSFTPPAGRPKVKPEPTDSLLNASEDLDGEATGGVNLTPKNKLELKMSKKIALNKKPMTVRELFETGLLDGVTVVYMGCHKFQGSGLRGTIRDGGILCSCTSCNGCRVIPPSKFEIHACKTYKRAAQYICLENGKSLLDLLRACRASPLHTLEATIQNIIGSTPEEKYFTCKRCKGCCPRSCVAKTGLLCNSCVDSLESHDTPTHEDGQRASTSVLFSKPSRTASGSISPHNKGQWKASVSVSPQNKSQWKLKTKSPKRVLFSKYSKSASACIPSKNKRPWKITEKSSKSVLISRSSKSVSFSIPSQNKSPWKITTKDQRLHKLVFEEDGLPDGTEVAYYARGQKILEGYKKGFGIFCRCCNSVVSPSQFEAHAGWGSRRKPYAYIYTSNGVSLHELAISLSKDRKYSAKDNDNLCIICADGGNLLLCDGCPRAFHKGEM